MNVINPFLKTEENTVPASIILKIGDHIHDSRSRCAEEWLNLYCLVLLLPLYDLVFLWCSFFLKAEYRGNFNGFIMTSHYWRFSCAGDFMLQVTEMAKTSVRVWKQVIHQSETTGGNSYVSKEALCRVLWQFRHMIFLF